MYTTFAGKDSKQRCPNCQIFTVSRHSLESGTRPKTIPSKKVASKLFKFCCVRLLRRCANCYVHVMTR
jgi:hypothetical protein